jgi:GNAT superfamily N-acetyltransferase
MISRIRRAGPEDQPLLDEVDAGLGRFNDQAAPLHEVQSLACVAEAEDGSLIGGLLGRTWGACAEIQQLWITEDARKGGVGRALLNEFEHAARERGVSTFYLETWSFQARGFYESCGYAVALEINGMGPGLAKYTMLKRLS